jgi:hypothetical protein
MKRDPRQHVLPGQPMRLAAEQINRINALTRTSVGVAGTSLNSPEPARNIVLCRNDSGDAIARWGVLEVSGVVFDPSSGDAAKASFEDQPVIVGVTPTDAVKPFAIAVEPIPDGGIGRVALSGVVQAKIEVVSESHSSARSKGSSSEIQSADDGPAKILWKSSGTGAGKWCLIRAGAGVGSGGARFGEVSAAWNKGAVATVTRLYPDGSDYEPSQTFQALNQFATLAAPGAGDTRFVMCVLVETTWMLVAAEC